MRLCDIIDIKSEFMKKTDLSVEEIQTIIDDIPTAFDRDKVIEQLEEYGTCKDKCSNKSCCYSCKDDVIDRSDAIDIVEAGGMNAYISEKKNYIKNTVLIIQINQGTTYQKQKNEIGLMIVLTHMNILDLQIHLELRTQAKRSTKA